MVNAVRTLLLNRDGPAPAVDGEEYVPAGFRAVPLPGPLKEVRAVLFGQAPDRRMLLHRLRQYLAILHAGDLAGDVTAEDPRITYLPLERGGFELVGGVEVTPGPGQPGPIYLVGDAPGTGPAGVARRAWELTLAL